MATKASLLPLCVRSGPTFSGKVAWVERVSGQQVLSSDVYFISNLPSDLQAADVLLICGAAFSLSFLATLYPSWRAAQIQPAEALRYE